MLWEVKKIMGFLVINDVSGGDLDFSICKKNKVPQKLGRRFISIFFPFSVRGESILKIYSPLKGKVNHTRPISEWCKPVLPVTLKLPGTYVLLKKSKPKTNKKPPNTSPPPKAFKPITKSEGEKKSPQVRLTGTAGFHFVYYFLSLEYGVQRIPYKYFLFNIFSASTGT